MTSTYTQYGGDCDNFGLRGQASPVLVSPFNKLDIYDTSPNFLAQNISDCQYYAVDDKLPCNAKNTSLLMLYVNIVSLQKNFDSFYEIISQSSNALHIIRLFELRLKTSTGITTTISLPGYKFLLNNTSTNAGGSAIYVDASLRFEIMHALTT